MFGDGSNLNGIRSVYEDDAWEYDLLHVAVLANAPVECLEYVLSLGFGVNDRETFRAQTPLHIAVQKGYTNAGSCVCVMCVCNVCMCNVCVYIYMCVCMCVYIYVCVCMCVCV